MEIYYFASHLLEPLDKSHQIRRNLHFLRRIPGLIQELSRANPLNHFKFHQSQLFRQLLSTDFIKFDFYGVMISPSFQRDHDRLVGQELFRIHIKYEILGKKSATVRFLYLPERFQSRLGLFSSPFEQIPSWGYSTLGNSPHKVTEHAEQVPVVQELLRVLVQPCLQHMCNT